MCAIVWVGGCAFVIAYNRDPVRDTARVTAAAAQLPTLNYKQTPGVR